MMRYLYEWNIVECDKKQPTIMKAQLSVFEYFFRIFSTFWELRYWQKNVNMSEKTDKSVSNLTND